MAMTASPQRGSEPVRYTTGLRQNGKTATGIEVPPDVIDALGAGRRPALRVNVNGYAYRTTAGVMGGISMIPLNAEHRAAAGLQGGQAIEVALEVDTAPRTVSVPEDFGRALEADPDAKATFEGLSNSNKSWHVLSIEGAKSAETRQRRIEKSVVALHAGRAR